LISFRILLLVAGWASVAYLFHKIANTSDNSSHAVYDPFKILDIAVGATEKEIKKHYKKLSIKFHPDKLQVSANQTKEQIESHFVDITKAYKSLTDETIRKNFELYGHPDGRQEMSLGIALPAWVIEGQNNIWVLGIYGSLVSVCLTWSRAGGMAPDHAQRMVLSTQLLSPSFNIFVKTLLLLVSWH
jgi:translocation protein SEC63